QIFGNIEEIYELHLAIAEQLDRATNEETCIGSVFLANVTIRMLSERGNSASLTRTMVS
ncbi:unnamed protein product, partial [Rotaria magnacalcarata]